MTPEQKRAVFLKLQHDRPLTKADLRGTGLRFVGPSSETESLVVPKKGLEKLKSRLQEFSENTADPRPKGTDFATAVQTISIGNPWDRLSGELASDYQTLIKEEFVIYEIEVASFSMQAPSRSREVKATLEELRQFLGIIEGRIYEVDFAGSGARAVLSSTGEKLRALVEDPRWWRRITLFDKRPHFQTFESVYRDFSVSDSNILPPPPGAETICIIDTGIAAANPLLKKVLRADISRSFIPGFAADADLNGHGSGVAALAAYYQIDTTKGGTNAASAFVASARITNDAGQLDTVYTDDNGVQRVREARLLSNILKEVVQTFRPAGVRVFVLSFNIVGHVWSNAARRLVPRNSWVARTIDQLSREHDVVFVAITGNLAPSEIQDLSQINAYPQYLFQPMAKLLDPGQAALAVTVGSIAQSERVVVSPALPIARENEPSPFTRTGPGFDLAVKPDFVERGGNLVNDPHLGVHHNAGTNVVTASGRLTPPLQHANGTSYAGPRVANHIATILRELRSIIPEPSACLIRAFLAVSAKPPSASTLNLNDSLKTIGYGLPDATRATTCAGHSVVLFYDGVLSADNVALFRVPVPVELRDSGRAAKCITLAVAVAPPVQAWGVAEYLGAQLKFRLFRGDKPIDHIVSMMQREDGEENVASEQQVQDIQQSSLKIRRRSVGTLQRDVFEWNDHDPSFSTDDYILAVSLSAASWCKAGPVAVPVGIALRIEDTSGICQQLYSRVRARVPLLAKAKA